MHSHQLLRRCLHRRHREGAGYVQAITAHQRVAHRRPVNRVTIPAPPRIETRMEPLCRWLQAQDSDLFRQQRVPPSVEVCQAMSPHRLAGDYLPCSVNAGVGAPGCQNASERSGQLFQATFKFLLDAGSICLTLKTTVLRAVVGDNGFHPHSSFSVYLCTAYYSATNSKSTIGAASPWRAPSLSIRV